MSSTPQYTIVDRGPAAGGRTAVLRGRWVLRNLEAAERVVRELQREHIEGLSLAELEAFDSAGVMLLERALRIGERTLLLSDQPPAFETLRVLVRERIETAGEPELPPSRFEPLERLGRSTVAWLRGGRSVLAFLGHLLTVIGSTIRSIRTFRVREFVVQLDQVLVNAIPIVALVTFLIGIVVAYLFASQSQKYGANIFIVDAVSIAMCRELSPILVAIIVAGRSGSAFTAQLGAMKLNEEIDALNALGLSPMRVLVLPRVAALMVAMPLLVVVGNVVGILGGILIADGYVGVTVPTFLSRLQSVLTLRSVFVGIVKAPVFAFFIALIGCRSGLMVEQNARSVGLNTTATVVRSIVSVILLNAAFAVLFVELGI